MRFFINQKIREPCAIGMYYEHKLKQWIVYKVKRNGKLHIRYRGRSEARAANIMWNKIRLEYAKITGNISMGFDGWLHYHLIPDWMLMGIAVIVSIVVIWGVARIGKPQNGYYYPKSAIQTTAYYYTDPNWYYWNNGTWMVLMTSPGNANWWSALDYSSTQVINTIPSFDINDVIYPQSYQQNWNSNW